MPSLQATAFIALAIDLALLAGLLYVLFCPFDLSYASRMRILKRVFLGAVVAALGLVFFEVKLKFLWPLMLGSNAAVLAVSLGLFWRRQSSGARGNDPAWLRGYVHKLETELSERRLVERDLAFMAAMAERDPNCVIELDVEGHLGYLNPAALTIFPDLESKGTKHAILAGFQELIDLLRQKGLTVLRRPLRYEERVFEQQITWSAEAQKVCLYMTDVTEWKRLDQLKTELLNTVSHEFRSPLSSLSATAKMLEAEMLGPVNEEQRRMLNLMQNSTDRLTRMISDLLDISKIEAGKFDLKREDVDIATLVENVAMSFEPLARERGIELVTSLSERPIPCLVDPDKIVQVVTNLMNNALKFTQKGRITLKASSTPEGVVVAVQDTGIGIPTDQMHRVFGKFQQMNSAVHGEKGTGLGLSLCKNLVELHKGSIRVDSVHGEGTTFSFMLPKISMQSVFNEALSRLYEEASSAGRCFSAFVVELEDAPGLTPFAGRDALAAELEQQVRKRLKNEQDIALRQKSRLFFILDGLNKVQAKAVVDELVADLIPVARKAGAEERVVVRAQFISLPDDGTVLEGLQAQLAA